MNDLLLVAFGVLINISSGSKFYPFYFSRADTRKKFAAVMESVNVANANASPSLAARHASARIFRPIVLHPAKRNRSRKYVRDMANASVIRACVIRGALEVSVKARLGMRLWTRCASFMNHVSNALSTENSVGNVPTTKTNVRRNLGFYINHNFTRIFRVSLAEILTSFAF